MILSELLSSSIPSANRSWRVLVLLYGSILLLAAVIAFGFHSALTAGLGNSMNAQELMETFDSNIYNDFLRNNEGFFEPFVAQVTWLGIAWLLLNTLFGGGMIAALQRGSSTSFSEFFSDCGLYFARFLRLLLLSSLILLIVGGVWMMILGFLLAAFTAGAETEVPNIIGFFIAVGGFLLPMVILMTVIDYTRVRIVLEGSSSVIQSLWEATKFVFKNFLSAMAWQLFMVLAMIVLFVVFWKLSGWVNPVTGFGIFGVFLIQQAGIASRLWARLAMIGGQIQLHETRNTFAPSTVSGGFVPPVQTPLPPLPPVPVKKASSAPTKRSATKRKSTRKR